MSKEDVQAAIDGNPLRELIGASFIGSYNAPGLNSGTVIPCPPLVLDGMGSSAGGKTVAAYIEDFEWRPWLQTNFRDEAGAWPPIQMSACIQGSANNGPAAFSVICTNNSNVPSSVYANGGILAFFSDYSDMTPAPSSFPVAQGAALPDTYRLFPANNPNNFFDWHHVNVKKLYLASDININMLIRTVGLYDTGGQDYNVAVIFRARYKYVEIPKEKVLQMAYSDRAAIGYGRSTVNIISG